MCYDPAMAVIRQNRLSRRTFLAGAGALSAYCLGGCKNTADLTFGSKNFQEQWILAALLALVVEQRTKRSARTRDLGGTFLCHEALRSGQINSYVEYTGTAYTAVLRQEPIADAHDVYERVKRAYADKFDVVWLPPLGFGNPFAIVVRRADAKRHRLVAISDLTKVATDFRPGFGFEFYERADGYPGLIETYDLRFEQQPLQMRLSQTYQALAQGDVDVIAGSFTDGLIEHLDLVVLEDDRGYFPPYEAAPLVRKAAMERYPEAIAAIASLGGTITAKAMRRANLRIDRDSVHPTTVARELLATLPSA